MCVCVNHRARANALGGQIDKATPRGGAKPADISVASGPGRSDGKSAGRSDVVDPMVDVDQMVDPMVDLMVDPMVDPI